MAARKKSTSKRVSRRPAALARLEQEFPSLREFSRKVGQRLNQLEREVERVEAEGRRRITRLVREASRELGRLEAQGEKRWRTLTARARGDALGLLKKLERALEGSERKPAPQRPAPAPAPRASQPAPRAQPAAPRWQSPPGGDLP